MEEQFYIAQQNFTSQTCADIDFWLGFWNIRADDSISEWSTWNVLNSRSRGCTYSQPIHNWRMATVMEKEDILFKTHTLTSITKYTLCCDSLQSNRATTFSWCNSVSSFNIFISFPRRFCDFAKLFFVILFMATGKLGFWKEKSCSFHYYREIVIYSEVVWKNYAFSITLTYDHVILSYHNN